MLECTDFALRHFRAGQDQADAPLTSTQPFPLAASPSMWMSFQEGGVVTRTPVTAGDGGPALCLELRPGPSHWMAFEIILDAAALLSCGGATLALQAASTPRIQATAVLRVPVAGDRPFVDTPPHRFVLDATMRTNATFFPLPDAPMAPNPACPSPRLVLLLPLREIALYLRSLTFGPA